MGLRIDRVEQACMYNKTCSAVYSYIPGFTKAVHGCFWGTELWVGRLNATEISGVYVYKCGGKA
jgi:hypothetical protein